jgi:response regulator of citrate/malate metabolism
MGKMLLISKDEDMVNSLNGFAEELDCECFTFNSSNDPLDIISEVISKNPTLLLLDDDFVSPNTVKLLESLKKVNPKLSVIFITSDLSLEFGRTVNSIGVKFYLLKPIDTNNLKEFIKSVRNQNQKFYY